jgi:hypothetical protein
MSTPPPDDVQYLDLADYLWLARPPSIEHQRRCST